MLCLTGEERELGQVEKTQAKMRLGALGGGLHQMVRLGLVDLVLSHLKAPLSLLLLSPRINCSVSPQLPADALGDPLNN